MEPRIQYAKTSDGVNIAFFTLGEGMPIVMLEGGIFSNVQKQRQRRPLRESFDFVAARWKLVAYDRRGFGLSQRDVDDFSLDKLALDVEAVVAHLALETFTLFAPMLAGPVGIAYAARRPDRVSHLILLNSYASGDIFWQSPRSRAFRALRETDWKTYTEAMARFFFEDPEQGVAFINEAATPGVTRKFMAATEEFDASGLLSMVTCPTLVLHFAADTLVDSVADEARRLAASIAGAGLAEARRLAAGIAGAGLVVVNDPESALRAIEKFLPQQEDERESAPAATPPEASAFRTILFTDIEGSTALTQRLGDAKARDLLREHERIVREALKSHGGSEVKTMGDGFMASFSSATKALECAIAIQQAFAEHNESAPEPILVRVGLNAGEPIAEEEDLFGTAVNLAARICSRAEAGQILAPVVVRELAAGKPFMFADLGETELRGFEDPVRLFEVRWREEAG